MAADHGLQTCVVKQAKFQLEADGVPEEDITVSGIPSSWQVLSWPA